MTPGLGAIRPGCVIRFISGRGAATDSDDDVIRVPQQVPPVISASPTADDDIRQFNAAGSLVPNASSAAHDAASTAIQCWHSSPVSGNDVLCRRAMDEAASSDKKRGRRRRHRLLSGQRKQQQQQSSPGALMMTSCYQRHPVAGLEQPQNNVVLCSGLADDSSDRGGEPLIDHQHRHLCDQNEWPWTDVDSFHR